MISSTRFAGIPSGIKKSGPDLGLVVFGEGTNVLSLYTRNKVKAAHILYNRRVEVRPVRALLVNSGCANACTGKDGVGDLRVIANHLAQILHILPGEILFASTGVIGRRLPTEKIVASLPALVKNLSDKGLETFAQAMMTTDTYPKVAVEGFRGKKNYRIVGVAKGAGMINPLFATMLAFVFTDFPVSPEAARRHFVRAAKESFEKISVDGECSTNDTILLFTRAGEEDSQGLDRFQEKLAAVLRGLALMVVRDGEGATRVIHITVNGARKKDAAEKIARRIAISPLTKTAFFGCDPNWGRVIAAAGDAGVSINPSRVEIRIQGEVLAREGMEVPFDEALLKRLMSTREVELFVDLHDGKASFDMFTTDLTYDYVKINASYRS
jgi:glutamate N-acetyltransferase/amino-acid N-acetyltransferase